MKTELREKRLQRIIEVIQTTSQFLGRSGLHCTLDTSKYQFRTYQHLPRTILMLGSLSLREIDRLSDRELEKRIRGMINTAKAPSVSSE